MLPQLELILEKALRLGSADRARLVDELLASFDPPERARLDALRAHVAEERIAAYERGEIAATPAEDVFGELTGGESSDMLKTQFLEPAKVQ